MDTKGTSTPAERTSESLDSTLKPDALVASRMALSSIEHDLVGKRRKIAGVADDAPRVGLALSGGGIRSATYCLGLLRGLAQNGVLTRIDYLSTVSGGGYVGAAFTRMVQKLGIRRAQDMLARSDSLVLEWLRRNGRYLAPQGARDAGVAVATYLRSAVAAHIDIAALAIVLGVIVVLPHVLHSDFPLVRYDEWRDWESAWFVIAASYWAFAGPSTFAPYWMLRDRRSNDNARSEPGAMLPNFRSVAVLVLLGTLAFVATRDFAESLALPARGPTWTFFATLVVAGTFFRHLSVMVRLGVRSNERPNTRIAHQRHRLTHSFRRANLCAIVLVALGIVDVVTWELKLLLADTERWLAGGLTLGMILVVLRALSEPLQRMARSTDGPHARWMPQLLNAVGVAVGVIVLCVWILLVQWFVFADPAGSDGAWLAHLPYWTRAAAIGAVSLLWIGTTCGNHDSVNTSSLHSFYRARLVRAYLALGNGARFGDHVGGIDGSPDALAVTAVVPGDDTDLANHRPEATGGPLHLIGVCLNQTREAASGMYNADRKGLATTLSARGMEVGNDRFIPAEAIEDLGTLGRWIAVSGAAASPGAGAYTSRGWAALLFMLGARLGFWFRPLQEGGEQKPSEDSAHRRVGRWFGSNKFGLLASEALASFAGRDRRWWYFSDGGHFDNTGVHALLQRQLDFIMLADCGADERFEYGDIENLVRKARIDFDCDIEFYSPDSFSSSGGATSDQIAVLSPEQLAKNYTERGLLLARICYGRSTSGQRKIGTLLVVKPNLHVALDGDVLAYARRHPAFPHQSTSDQFFDEAQWESYHRLGEDMGRALQLAWLEKLPGWKARVPMPDPFEPLRKPVRTQARDEPSAFWRPETKAAALGATIGIGALGTVALPIMQSYQQWQIDRQAEDRSVIQALDESSAFLFDEAGSLVLPSTSTTAHVRVIVAAKNEGKVSARVRRLAAQRVDSIAARCSAPEDEAKVCDPSRHPLCDAVCEEEIEDYWKPTPPLDRCRNTLVARMDACVRSATGEIEGVPPRVSVGLPVFHPDVGWTGVLASEARDPGMVQVFTASTGGAPVGNAEHGENYVEDAGRQALLAELEGACVVDATPMTLYIQVYDEQTRARAFGVSASAPFGGFVRVPTVENVVETARMKSQTPPARWSRPTLLVHRPLDVGDRSCAEAIAKVVRPHLPELQVRDLPPSMISKRRIIELWIPPLLPSAR